MLYIHTCTCTTYPAVYSLYICKVNNFRSPNFHEFWGEILKSQNATLKSTLKSSHVSQSALHSNQVTCHSRPYTQIKSRVTVGPTLKSSHVSQSALHSNQVTCHSRPYTQIKSRVTVGPTLKSSHVSQSALHSNQVTCHSRPYTQIKSRVTVGPTLKSSHVSQSALHSNQVTCHSRPLPHENICENEIWNDSRNFFALKFLTIQYSMQLSAVWLLL